MPDPSYYRHQLILREQTAVESRMRVRDEARALVSDHRAAEQAINHCRDEYVRGRLRAALRMAKGELLPMDEAARRVLGPSNVHWSWHCRTNVLWTLE